MHGSTSASRCSGVPNSWTRITVGKLPTIEASLWGSLCNPMPRRFRCSRTTAIARFDPSRPADLRRERVAIDAGAVGPAAGLAEQFLPLAARHAARLDVG